MAGLKITQLATQRWLNIGQNTQHAGLHILTQHAGLFRKPKLESFLPFVGLHFYDSGLFLLGYSHNFTFA